MRRARAVTALLLGAGLGAGVLTPAAGQAPGDASRGQELFVAKHCTRCHLPHGQRGMGPPLDGLRRPQGAYEVAGRLWNHAPAMFTALKQEGIAWPQISAAEMAEIMTYLRAAPDRDPPPDMFKGQALLVTKGCLKCHTFRKEGGRIAPDLVELRASFAPAPTWAATMWRHAPRMAALAIQEGLLYPRFSGDEMVNLLGYLRRAGGR